ncbi:hypothetical protein [Umezawaea tangerina]|uniref:Adenylate kinase family enzyme n=1 Tax=Umezawaea tangerina TaxID=84725 RepID=A0A2T0SVU0_9PSEU|nr:hypothetical protein [Umezawaea tangerina]PRY37510.1 adenylate kinase family enzyme [Umezawaea tangerina]
MPAYRLLVTGASGAGTTTLGRVLAARWHVPHADLDDYFWVPTDPPFAEKRPEGERLRLMREVFLPRASWVLSGSLMGWGDSLIPMFDGVVLLTIDPEVRMRRLTSREHVLQGEAVGPGGANEEAYRAFLDWAQGYDDPEFSGRNRAKHEQWLTAQPHPVLRLDSETPVEELADRVVEWLAAVPARAGGDRLPG